MEADAAMTDDLIAYNIIPLDGPSTTNAIGTFPEVSLLYPEIQDLLLVLVPLYNLDCLLVGSSRNLSSQIHRPTKFARKFAPRCQDSSYKGARHV